MKKLLLAFVLAVTSGLTLADYVVLETGHGVEAGATSSSNDIFFKYNLDINKNFAVDVENLTVQVQKAGASTYSVQDRVETGLVGKLPLGSATLQGRVSYGEKMSSTNYYYYTYAPSIIAPLADTGFSVKAEYRWRKSQTSGLEDTQIQRYSLFYALTKTDTIGYRFDRYTGTTVQNINSINYMKSF